MAPGMDDRLESLLRRTQEFGARMAATLTDLRPARATSAGGAVVVSVDGSSGIADIEVYDGWRREADGAAALGVLVLRTLGAALTAQFGTWAEHAPDALEAPVAPEGAPATATAAAPPPGPAGDEVVAQTSREMGSLPGAVDELVAALRTTASLQHEGRDTGGHATAVADGRGNVVSLAFDEQWLETTSASRIGPAAATAIRAAIERARSSTDLEAVVRSSRLGVLQASLTDHDPTA